MKTKTNQRNGCTFMGLAKVLPDSTIVPMILYDTSMTLFCKEERKVSLKYYSGFQEIRYGKSLENDTMTLSSGKKVYVLRITRYNDRFGIIAKQ